MNQDAKEIGRRIQARRKELSLSQDMLGQKLGLNKSTIARYENGSVEKIKLPIIQTMAEILNVNPDWLVLKTNNKGKYSDCLAVSKDLFLTIHEQQLIYAYRENVDMQRSVDKLLGI